MQSHPCWRTLPAVVVGMLGLAVLSGCGGSSVDLAPVEGTVTLDGDPLENAEVIFEPEEGSPSMGETDSNGNYKLMYTLKESGALIGKHTVRITSASITEDEQGNDVTVPERVPAKYNWKSELVKEVTEGSNTIDFQLESGEEIIQPSALEE